MPTAPGKIECMLGSRKPRAKRPDATPREPESTTIEVYFSGPAVEEHSMSVRDLAPALLGLADAIDQYKELTTPFVDLDVKITATKAGSFDVFLQILGTMVSFGQGSDPEDVVQIAAGVMDVIKILIARYNATRDLAPSDGEVVKQSDASVDLKIGNASLTVSRKSYIASRNGAIINSLGEATRPAASVGYDPVRFIHKDSGKEETVNAATSEAMSELALSDQPIDPSLETTTLQIDTVQFNSDKWKFIKGDEKFWCEIRDPVFLKKWENHQIAFFSGDLLKVRLQTEQYVQNGQLKTGRRSILEVIKVIQIERQPTLGI